MSGPAAPARRRSLLALGLTVPPSRRALHCNRLCRVRRSRRSSKRSSRIQSSRSPNCTVIARSGTFYTRSVSAPGFASAGNHIVIELGHTAHPQFGQKAEGRRIRSAKRESRLGCDELHQAFRQPRRLFLRAPMAAFGSKVPLSIASCRRGRRRGPHDPHAGPRELCFGSGNWKEA